MNKSDKKKAFKQLVKSIQKSNKTFAAASPDKKILMVAKDVLALLKLDRIKAITGTYVAIPVLEKDDLQDCQVSDLLKNSSLPTCSVCGVGAAIVASTLRLNEVKVNPHSYFGSELYIGYNPESFAYAGMDTDASNKVREVFPGDLLREMERAFEYCYYGYEMQQDWRRLKAIYKNLVKNKGKKFTEYDGKEVIWEV